MGTYGEKREGTGVMGLAGQQGEYRAEARVDTDAKGNKRKREELESGQRHAFDIWKVLEISKGYMRYLKRSCSVADRPDLCSENSLDEEEDSG